MKEQIKTPEKEQNNKEIDNLSDTEFKTLVIRMHRIGWVWSQNEGRNKPPTRTEWRKRILKNEERLRNLYDNFKHSNIRIIGMPEGKEQAQENENLCEQIMGKKTSPIWQKSRKLRESQRNWIQEETHQGTSMGGKIQGIRNITGRHKIDRGRLRIA